MHQIHVERIYDGSLVQGTRVLVDRLWPRGVSKAEAKIDLWLKEVAPTTELRKWFSHEPARFAEFRARYLEELETNPTQRHAFEELLAKVREEDVVLVYGAKDKEHNQAVILQEALTNRMQLDT